MSKKKERIALGSDASPLTDNPFAALADKLPKDLPQHQENATEDDSKAVILPDTPPPYTVGRTRKGNYDISFERRAKGKGVTVVRRVEGDGTALLKQLKKQCGAGGSFHEGCIEIQGDHRDAIEKILRNTL